MTEQETRLADLLHNLHPQSVSGSHEHKVGYAKGVLVSTIALLMAFDNHAIDDAIAIVARLAPRVVIAGCCPDSWTKQFGMPQVGEQNESWDDKSVARTGPAFTGSR